MVRLAIGAVCGFAISMIAQSSKGSCGDTATQLAFIEETYRRGQVFAVRSERLSGSCVFAIDREKSSEVLNEEAAKQRINAFMRSQ